MNKETAKMMQHVEKTTGYRVSVGSGTGFLSYARMTTATPQSPVHRIDVNQKNAAIGDYIVALQCAMILIKWSNPERIPVSMINEEKVHYQIEKCIKNRKLFSLPQHAALQFSSNIINGLVQQLLSLPIEMIAVKICQEECPSLEGMMDKALNNEIQEIHQSLRPDIKQLTPEDIFEKNATMNAAFALNYSRISRSQHALMPFMAEGILDKGKELLKIYDDQLGTYSEKYINTVDEWAQRLKMATLYSWEYRRAENDN